MSLRKRGREAVQKKSYLRSSVGTSAAMVPVSVFASTDSKSPTAPYFAFASFDLQLHAFRNGEREVDSLTRTGRNSFDPDISAGVDLQLGFRDRLARRSDEQNRRCCLV